MLVGVGVPGAGSSPSFLLWERHCRSVAIPARLSFWETGALRLGVAFSRLWPVGGDSCVASSWDI